LPSLGTFNAHLIYESLHWIALTHLERAFRSGIHIGSEAEEIVSLPIFYMLAGAPRPVAPFSHAVEIDGWVFVTGQLPIDADDFDAPIPEGIAPQTHKVFANLKSVLAGLGLGLEHVVCARAFLTHFYEDYEHMNRIYESYFPADRRPARTCVGVTGLARACRVEIDFIARRP
jgi:reactive intermediate/imine deaminase